MAQVTVSEEALRELVKEALDGGHLGDMTVPEDDDPVNVNPVVDPSAAVTDPINPSFVPQTKPELDVAVKQLTKDVPIDSVPHFYKTLRAVLDAENAKNEEDEEMKKAAQGGTEQVEETVRKAVRRMLSEINPGYRDPADVEADEEEAEARPGRRGANKSTALGGMADVGGASFEEIAKELNFSVAGAKQAVDKAIEKMRFMMVDMDQDDMEILILQTMNEYIAMLTKTGELSAADVQLMKDHPDIVRELDGFREYLSNAIRRKRKEGQKVIDPLGEGDGGLDEAPSGMLQCPDCKGTGWDDRNDKDCELCAGHGQISKRDLHGEGKHVKDFKEALASVGMRLVETKKPAGKNTRPKGGKALKEATLSAKAYARQASAKAMQTGSQEDHMSAFRAHDDAAESAQSDVVRKKHRGLATAHALLAKHPMIGNPYAGPDFANARKLPGAEGDEELGAQEFIKSYVKGSYR